MRSCPNSAAWIVTAIFLGTATAATPNFMQPKVNPGSQEPDWVDLLKQQWGLDMDRDLRNPVIEGAASACMFKKAGKGPVTFTPIIALGLETTTRGGWYQAKQAGTDAARLPTEVWAYAYKQPAGEMESGQYTPPHLASGSTSFDPGDVQFGLWVSNDHFQNETVRSDPGVNAATIPRFKKQPFKAMIYPNVDIKTGKLITHSYIIGWEYSTNDDFQDVVTRVDNVTLLPSPTLPGIIEGDAAAKKLADGFKFTEGPTWDVKRNALYFSDIPPGHIVRYQDGKAEVANTSSNNSNGLMMDQSGALIACEHGGRRVSRAPSPGQPAETIADRYQGKRLNSPNDLWIDATGGIYFTDPRYGKRDDLEQDREAVYYISKAPGNTNDRDREKITRILNVAAAPADDRPTPDNLIRPNGIALSPDGKTLYVIDHGADCVNRYPVQSPGIIGKGERIAYTPWPDGMTVDQEGRLYVTSDEGVIVLNPDGKWIGVITVAERPANCTFGGQDYRTLFVTACKSLYGIETQTRGWHVHLDGVPNKD